MRKSVFQVNRRQQAVLEQLERDGVVYVSRLSQKFSVSEITIRRDLESMERAHLLTRFHGGARVMEEPAETVPLFDEKGLRNIDEKLLIAKKVAELIQEDDMVFMNSGSTVTVASGGSVKSATLSSTSAKLKVSSGGKVTTASAKNKSQVTVSGTGRVTTLKVNGKTSSVGGSGSSSSSSSSFCCSSTACCCCFSRSW